MPRAPRPPKPLGIGVSHSLTFTPDSQSLIVAGRRVFRWSLAAGERADSCHPFANVHRVDCAPDGARFAAKNTAGRICVMPAAEMTAAQVLPDKKASPGCRVLFSPCGEHLVDGSWDGRLTVRDAASGRVELEERVDAFMLRWLASDPARQLFAYVRSPTARFEGDHGALPTVFVRRWPFHEHPESAVPGHWPDADAVAPSPDRARLAILDRAQLCVVALDGPTRVVRRALGEFGQTGQLNRALAWSPDGGIVACTLGDAILFLDSATLECRHRHVVRHATDIAYSADGRFVAIGGWNDGVVLAVDPLGRRLAAGDEPSP